MYLATRSRWAHAPSVPEGGPVAIATPDGGVPTKGKKKKKKRPRASDGTEVPLAPGEEEYEYEETAPVVLTAADKKLETRGDSTELPPQKIDMGGDADARKLDDGEINSVLSGQSGDVRQCVIKAATGVELSATITVTFVVDANGKVIKSKLNAPHYLFEHGLLGCAQKALRGMRFPATGLPTKVDFPVNLN